MARTIILDGALATQLEARGADLNDPLWSCKTLLEQPDLIRDVHRQYYLAGANVATTATYQATHAGLANARGFTTGQADDLIRKSVDLAREARDEVLALPGHKQRELLVAGSVGPYGAYLADGSEYRGDYSRPKDEFKSFHRPRIRALVEAKVDLLALETMPNVHEIEALIEVLAEFPNVTAWLSCTLRDDTSSSDGTPLQVIGTMAQNAPQIIAVGVNCVPKTLVGGALSALAQVVTKPLICYPNSGETYDAATHSWSGSPGEDWASVGDWHATGARWIGGCCRTSPKDIQTIAATLG